MKPETILYPATIISLIVLSIIVFVVWNNKDTHRILPVVLKVTGAIIFAGAILWVDFLKENNDFKSIVYIGVLFKDSGEVAQLGKPLSEIDSDHGRGYRNIYSLYGHSISPEGELNPPIENLDEWSLDLMHATLWTWMSFKYSQHWDIEPELIRGVNAVTGFSPLAEGAEKNPTEIAIIPIIEEISPSLKWVAPNVVKLPFGTTENRFSGINDRIIELKNKNLVLEMKISRIPTMPSINDRTALGRKIRNRLREPDKWSYKSFRIEFRRKFNRWRIFSSYTARQKRWIDEMVMAFETDFSWNEIRKELKGGLDKLPADAMLD